MIFRLNKDNLSAALHEVAVAIDSQKYNKKPTGGEIGAIRNRLSGRNAHAALTIEQIADKIAHGYTIQGAQLRDKQNTDENTDERFIQQQLFAVDIDNDTEIIENGEKVKVKSQSTIDTAEQIFDIFRNAGIEPCIIHESFSSGKTDINGAIIPKFHVFVASDKPVKENTKARQIIQGLQHIIGEDKADKACSDPARLLFGTARSKKVYVNSAVNSSELLLSLSPAPAEEPAPVKPERTQSQSAHKEEEHAQRDFEKICNTEADPSRLLMMIDPNKLDYEEWLRVSAAYKHSEGAAPDIWTAWNNQYSNVKEKADLKAYKAMTGKGITKGTLKYFAQQHSPAEWSSYIEELKPRRSRPRTASKNPHPERGTQSGEHSAEPAPERNTKEQGDNPYNKDGSGMLTEENMWEALRIQNISIRFNEILHTPEIQGKCLEQRYVKESFSAVLPVYLYDVLKKNHLKSVTVDKISGYINNILFSKQSVCNPILESIHAANWNGTDKLSELYTLMHISEGDTLSRVLLKKWLMQCYCALHNNINNPFPVEYVLVLVGKQGFGKTMLFEKLALNRRYFGEGKCFDPRDKDTKIQATSKWITELGEIGSTMKKDMDLVKAFISDRVDEYRVPYGKTPVQYVRRTSLCGSTNDMQFLIDETGNRRFLTVKLPDNEYIDANSKEFKEFDTLQLWRQIKHFVDEEIKSGAEYSSAFRLTREEQEQLDARNLLHSKPLKGEIEISEILSYNLMAERGYELGEEHITTTEFINKYSELRGISAVQAGKVLKKLGYNKIQMKIGGIPTSVYKLPYKKWINNNSAYNP